MLRIRVRQGRGGSLYSGPLWFYEPDGAPVRLCWERNDRRAGYVPQDVNMFLVPLPVERISANLRKRLIRPRRHLKLSTAGALAERKGKVRPAQQASAEREGRIDGATQEMAHQRGFAPEATRAQRAGSPRGKNARRRLLVPRLERRPGACPGARPWRLPDRSF